MVQNRLEQTSPVSQLSELPHSEKSLSSLAFSLLSPFRNIVLEGVTFCVSYLSAEGTSCCSHKGADLTRIVKKKNDLHGR